MQYSIVFNGKIRPGATLEETRKNLAEMFKLDNPTVLDRVFSGQNVILKKGLDEDEARKQEMILYMAGALCELRSTAPPAPPAPPPAEPAAAPAAVAPPPEAPEPRDRGAVAMMMPPQPERRTPEALSLRAEPPAATTSPQPGADDIVPAALRGRREPLPEAPPPDDSIRVTNLGRPGEGMLDPLHAPWDPAFVPDAVKGLSWAGFMAPLLWGTFNGMRLSFLPLLGIRLLRHWVPTWAWGAFYLAFGGFYLVKGRELAWQNKQWRNAEHFVRVQRYWTVAAALVFMLFAWGLGYALLLERRAEHMVAAATALAAAEERYEHATNPDARAEAMAERTRLRSDFLASIPDPAVRERQRQTFEEQDREEAAGAAQRAEEPEGADAPPASE